jgi:predicted PurR-regulated permease PerM
MLSGGPNESGSSAAAATAGPVVTEPFIPYREPASAVELVLRLGALALLIYLAFTLLRPFISVLIWSVVLAVALDPVYRRLTTALGGRPRLAAVLLTLLTLMVVIGPTFWLALSLVESVQLLADKLDPMTLAIPPPPGALRDWPLVGDPIYQFWELASTNLREALVKVGPQLKPVGGIALRVVTDAGTGILKFVLAVLIAGFLFPARAVLAAEFHSFARRLAGERGEEFVALAATTIRSISLGVIGVAVVQAMLAGAGFIVAGVPGVSLLTSAVLILGIVQIGSAIVLLPMIAWSWTTMDATSALWFTLYMIPVGLIDNILKPFVMGHGALVPMPVILLGLIGGTLAYGIAGLFLGPVVLAVLWKLLLAWIDAREGRDLRPPLPAE